MLPTPLYAEDICDESWVRLARSLKPIYHHNTHQRAKALAWGHRPWPPPGYEPVFSLPKEAVQILPGPFPPPRPPPTPRTCTVPPPDPRPPPTVRIRFEKGRGVVTEVA